MPVYRVEKDGVTFYIRPEMLGYYASEGYAIYKTVEEPILNVEEEIESVDMSGETAAIGGYDASQV